MVIDVSSLQEIKLSMNIVRTGAANKLIAQTLRSNDTEIEGGRGLAQFMPKQIRLLLSSLWPMDKLMHIRFSS